MKPQLTSTSEGRPKAGQTSATTLSELPLELLDVFLETSLLHWIMKSSKQHERDEDVIKALASVDFCWFQRITRRRFKNRIWQRLKGFYDKTKKQLAIIRNNRNYLLENIQPNDELIAQLLFHNCITEEQCQFIQRKRSTRDKNAELLYVLRTFDETKFSNVVKCIRRCDQKAVARIIDNGGVVVKVEVQSSDATSTASIDTQQLHQKIKDIQSKTKPRSYQTDKLISQLEDKDIEILNSQLDRQTLVVWIWCKSEEALNHFRTLFESNQLANLLMDITHFRPSTRNSDNFRAKLIDMDRYQFQTTVVVCDVLITFTKRLDMDEDEAVWAVTKLRNEICVLCLSTSFSSHAILFFEDRNPFCLRKKIGLKELRNPWDIASSEKENCLFVSDYQEKCIWKITKETDDQHKIVQWVKTDFQPQRISVSSNGNLVLVSYFSSTLLIYGSDAALIRLIQLPNIIQKPRHALETSTGNFIILHEWRDEEEKRSSGRMDWMWVVSELSSRDDQVVIVRSFSPTYDTQKLNDPIYLSLDSDDQVFVVDKGNDRVIVLDSNLNWNQILCPKEDDELRIRQPRKLCCDDENKQLIIAGDFFLEDGVNIYTLSQI